MIRLLFSGLVLCLLFSCEKPDIVGSAVLPSTDQPGLYFTDTTTISARTVEENPLIGSLDGYPFFLGSMNDEIGNSFASFYTQLRLGSFLTDGFNGVTTPDSIVLSLGYQTNYGDTNAVHHISVYEITESMSVDSLYKTSRDFTLSKDRGGIGSVTLVPNLEDSINVGTGKKPAQLRFRLNNELGARFMQQYIIDPLTFNSNAKFQEFFKGIYIKDKADGNGSILTFDPNSSLNGVTLYFRKQLTDTFSTAYNFIINENSVHNNRFSHKHNPAIFNSVNPTSLYVQSMAGLKIKIEFPNIMKMAADHAVSINKAVLVVKLKPGTNSILANNSSLVVYASDSLGQNIQIIDAFESNNVIGGLFVNGVCNLSISRYMQRLINGDVKNYGIFVAPAGSLSSARRTILEGQASVRLDLTYTLQNNN